MSAEKITVIYESITVPFENTNLDSNLLDQVNDEPCLLFVGDNRRHKNIDRIIEAHSIVFDENLHVDFIDGFCIME